MRFLVLSGGGAKGSFQVGCIKWLAEQGKQYDGFYGVSVGAINAASLAQFSDLKKGIGVLEKFWLNLKTSDVKKHWLPFSFLWGWKKKGLYNSAPLRKLVTDNFNSIALVTARKKLGVGAVSLTTGKFEVFTEKNPKIKDFVLASAMTPLFLDPIQIDGQLYYDGGARVCVPIQAAIDHGATKIDVIVTETADFSSGTPNNLLDVGTRTLDYMSHQLMEHDLELALAKNPKVKINIIRPLKPIECGMLDFNTVTTARNIVIGYDTVSRKTY